ncbi:ABC transporter ATP-binding protein [Novosphingobium sp.]|uniref:ABC transporter ATP-binding protein n=1 Tax=Novosphingobium sp. TaxID=1874826 RepID=UPI003D14A388
MVTIALDRVDVRLGRRTVVAGVSAELAPGGLIGMIGPNGAGKSTLVRALLGLVPLAGGTVRIDGRPIAEIARREMARSLAYLPQGQTLHWPLSVERLVALGRLPHLAPFSRPSAEDLAAIELAMVRADVIGLRARDATEMSGGERARVMLARALAVGAAGLVVDEPLASLDPGHQIDVMELLAGEAREGATVVAVLHDLTMAARYCARILLIDQGALVADGTPKAVLTPARLAQVYGIRVFVDADGTVPMIVPMGRP